VNPLSQGHKIFSRKTRFFVAADSEDAVLPWLAPFW